jgi:hypothetical protein
MGKSRISETKPMAILLPANISGRRSCAACRAKRTAGTWNFFDFKCQGVWNNYSVIGILVFGMGRTGSCHTYPITQSV